METVHKVRSAGRTPSDGAVKFRDRTQADRPAHPETPPRCVAAMLGRQGQFPLARTIGNCRRRLPVYGCMDQFVSFGQIKRAEGLSAGFQVEDGRAVTGAIGLPSQLDVGQAPPWPSQA